MSTKTTSDFLAIIQETEAQLRADGELRLNERFAAFDTQRDALKDWWKLLMAGELGEEHDLDAFAQLLTLRYLGRRATVRQAWDCLQVSICGGECSLHEYHFVWKRGEGPPTAWYECWVDGQWREHEYPRYKWHAVAQALARMRMV